MLPVVHRQKSAEKEICLKCTTNAKGYFENIFLYSREIFVLRVAEEIISLGREEQTVGQKIFEFGFYYQSICHRYIALAV